MLIITRYFTREFLKIFSLCLGAFISLYLLVDLLERVDDMIKNQVAFGLIIKYCLCSIPMIIYQVCPLGVLLCTFITIGLFVKHHEIMALRAHGVSLYRVLKVFVFIAVSLCFFSLWLQEYVLPTTNQIVKEIKNGTKIGVFLVGSILSNPSFLFSILSLIDTLIRLGF